MIKIGFFIWIIIIATVVLGPSMDSFDEVELDQKIADTIADRLAEQQRQAQQFNHPSEQHIAFYKEIKK